MLRLNVQASATAVTVRSPPFYRKLRVMRREETTVDARLPPSHLIDMNDQVASAIRSVLKVIGGALVTKGITDSSTIEVVIAGIVAAIGIGWSWAHHKATPPAS